jgi:hypothetical protein
MYKINVAVDCNKTWKSLTFGQKNIVTFGEIKCCCEFVALKLAVSQASCFQIWNIYCNISVEKDQICDQAYALV